MQSADPDADLFWASDVGSSGQAIVPPLEAEVCWPWWFVSQPYRACVCAHLCVYVCVPVYFGLAYTRGGAAAWCCTAGTMQYIRVCSVRETPPDEACPGARPPPWVKVETESKIAAWYVGRGPSRPGPGVAGWVRGWQDGPPESGVSCYNGQRRVLGMGHGVRRGFPQKEGFGPKFSLGCTIDGLTGSRATQPRGPGVGCTVRNAGPDGTVTRQMGFGSESSSRMG